MDNVGQTAPLYAPKTGDAVEVTLAGTVVSNYGGTVLVEFVLARPSTGRVYQSFIAQSKVRPLTDAAVTTPPEVQVPRAGS